MFLYVYDIQSALHGFQRYKNVLNREFGHK